MLKDQGDVSWI